MIYIKPELKIEMIEIKENIAGLDGWMESEGIAGAGITRVLVERPS